MLHVVEVDGGEHPRGEGVNCGRAGRARDCSSAKTNAKHSTRDGLEGHTLSATAFGLLVLGSFPSWPPAAYTYGAIPT
jgi:hypothetical protein